MDSKATSDISMLFKVSTLDDLSILLSLQRKAVKDMPEANEIYLKSVNVIDLNKGVVQVTGSYRKEELVTLIEEFGIKRPAGREASEAVKAFYAARADEEFKMMTLDDDYTIN